MSSLGKRFSAMLLASALAFGVSPNAQARGFGGFGGGGHFGGGGMHFGGGGLGGMHLGGGGLGGMRLGGGGRTAYVSCRKCTSCIAKCARSAPGEMMGAKTVMCKAASGDMRASRIPLPPVTAAPRATGHLFAMRGNPAADHG